MTKILFRNANVVTVDEQFSIADAIYIRDGRIVALGEEAEIAAAEAKAASVDLKGRSVLPGFVDTHGHIALFGLDELKVQVSDLKSPQAILERIAAAAKTAPAGAWLITTPLGSAPYFLDFEALRAKGEVPSIAELDAAAPNNPVYITAPTNRVPNSAFLNSQALALAGITATTETGAPISIELDKQGAMTGELRGAMQPLYNPHPFYQRIATLLPKITYEDTLEGIRRLGPKFAAAGTTALLEAHLTRPDELRAYRELLEDNNLPLRVFYTFELDPEQSRDALEQHLQTLGFAAGQGFGNARLRVNGISVGLDGPYWHGAACHDAPYPGPFGDVVNPSTLVPQAKYEEIVELAWQYNFRLHTECAGRGSIEMALEILGKVGSPEEIRRRRFVIEHCEFPTAAHIRQCAKLGIVPTTSTNFVWGKGAEVYRDRLGESYVEQAIPLRDWLDAGVPVCQSTDWGPREPLFTLWQSLVRHAGLDGHTVGEGQHISREEALRIFTINGAFALGMEREIGSLECGKRADLAIIDGDIMDCTVDEIREMRVLATLCDGEFTHGRDDAIFAVI